jgi:hypothetical protein
LKSEGIVGTKFTFLSRFAVKFVEVAGAGLASAACAYVFGQIERPQPPATPVVQKAPVSAERARMARDDRPLIGETARKETDSQPESAAATPTTVSTPKLAKLTQPAPPRRNQKSEQVPLAETKARSGEPLAILPSSAASNAAPKASGQSVQAPAGYEGSAASNGGEEDRPLLARLKQIPSWFLPENDRIFGELPRPPMPVGEFLQSSM